MDNSTLLENCKLSKLVLLESSSKLVNKNLHKANLELILVHEVEFSLLPDDDRNDFSLGFTSEIKAIDEEKNDYFYVSAKFLAKFNVFDKEKNEVKGFEAVSELLGHQLYPLIRSFFVDILVKMGLPPHIPWSIQQSPDFEMKGKKIAKARRKKS